MIQSRQEASSTYRSVTTTFAFDTTTWSTSEGTNILNVSIDPVSVGNRILLSARAYIGEVSTTVRVGGAIIRNAETVALPGCVALAGGTATGAGADANVLTIDCETEATVTTQETYNLYIGPATAATIHLNGNLATGQLLGNGFATNIRATEIER